MSIAHLQHIPTFNELSNLGTPTATIKSPEDNGDLNKHLGYLVDTIPESEIIEMPTIPTECLIPEIVGALEFINTYIKPKITEEAYQLAILYLYTESLPKGREHAFNNFISRSNAYYLTSKIVLSINSEGIYKECVTLSNAQLNALEELIEDLSIGDTSQKDSVGYRQQLAYTGFEYLGYVIESLEYGLINMQSGTIYENEQISEAVSGAQIVGSAEEEGEY